MPSVPGELPPPPPRIFFGRDELIDKVVHFVGQLMPIALIGTGGVGKTSIILAALHDDRVKQRFGDNRWFVRCDQFPTSHTNFLRRLSNVIGAGIENPEDLAPLRRYLSSKEMLIILDNAESILDPRVTSAQEIYAAVDELTQLSNICLCITSRISTIPPDCEILEIPTLSIEAARDTFYRIYKRSGQSDLIDSILKQLDFHPLSITLLATVTQHNKWDAKRLIREWERRRTGVLHAQHSRSLAATIELSLASPLFRELGPDARELLGVIAFFPQGVNEDNLDWLFPTISDGPDMFDKFCILSLTYRSDGFITMLAPLRDYLRPKDPMSSLLLGATKEHYFSRLSVDVHPDEPNFGESRWIISEGVNVEYLLDIFTSVDENSKSVWDTCARFMQHIVWHKPRLVTLGPKIEALPDDHPSKAQCLHWLAWLFDSVGNQVERKRLFTHNLELWRAQGDDYQVAQTLSELCDANQLIGLPEEGIRQGKEASEIFERLGDTAKQAESLIELARSLHSDKQLDAAEEAALHAIELLPEKGKQLHLCRSHRALGQIYDSKGDPEKAIHHFEVALRIASSLSYHNDIFWVHYDLAILFFARGGFDDAHGHIQHAKSHAVDDLYNLACASQLQALVWEEQHVFEEAKSEILRALGVFEDLGAADDAEDCRETLRRIDRNARGNDLATPSSDESDDDGEHLEPMLPDMRVLTLRV